MATQQGKHQRVIALRYSADKEMAPRVVAKGSGLLAQRIMEIARENGIQIHEDPDLVAVLSKLDLNVQIPENLYRAVAEVLAFVYQLNQREMKRPKDVAPDKRQSP